jgi:SAM-dependent methyltransferase
MDQFESFKALQKKSWAHFAPLEMATLPAAARLVTHARVGAGQRLLDVACGTGVVAVTAARRGATVTGLDLTPELLARARENAVIAAVAIEWHEGDVEHLPFDDGTFDVVTSQYGHMFAPRPEVAIAEMLRVLRPGGTIAFSTWPPELFVGRMATLVARYMPPPQDPVPAFPPLWGDPDIVLQRLGTAVTDVVFDRACLRVPALSPQHHRGTMERNTGTIMKLVEMLGTSAPEDLASFRRDYDALASEYFDENFIRQGYLMTRAIKR